MEKLNKKSILKVLGKIFVALLSLLIIWRIFIVFFPVYYVQTASMEPTISAESFILSKKINNPSEIQRGDMVLFEPMQGVSDIDWLHRIIATAGDTLHVVEGVIYVNDKEVIRNLHLDNMESIVIEDGYVFQAGDNPDSTAGLVSTDKIKAVVIIPRS